ncbi:RagB/SusD family nutrient uptake outer membrane protein [Chitinophaga defluvii]|uniref:RagB/SusD family nutrient uptake outer membrane protein n=1 Tax=Chitinophaga defluvii TaxID=3163343 RepID=A0ABV2TAW1_9BACT
MRYISVKCIKGYCFGFILISTLGCKKGEWYDVKTDKSLAVPSTLKDMQALLDNVGVLNGSTIALGEIGSDGHSIKDADAQRLGDTEYNAYTWSYGKPYITVADWASNNDIGAYPRIYYCNTILDGVKKLTPANNEEQLLWNSIKGQALFHRAKNFFDLAQVFAPPYNVTTANTDLSIPLRLESDINIPSKRSSVKETYEQIINDLLTAETLLPATPLFKTRASRPAVFALLARTYLCMQDYVNAKKFADSCLKNFNTLLDYNILSTTDAQPFTIFNPEVIFHSRMLSYRSIRAAMIIDPELYDLYDSNDLRKEIFFTKNLTTGEVKSKGTYTGTVLLFTGLASDEVYLIRAESNARSGNSKAAMEDLNNLLRKRWKAETFKEFTAIDAEDALRQVLNERKKELLLRGLRWSDLRRLNQDERFKITINRIISGTTYTLEPESFKYTLPIPDDIIQITGMTQNLGWGK